MLNIVKEATNIGAGIKGKIYAIPHEDIDVWPAFAADKKEYSGDFTLVTGKVWGVLELSKIAGEYQHTQENAGSVDNPSKTETVTVFAPGLNATTSKALDDAEGKEWVLLIPSKNNCASGEPIYKVVGDKCGGLDLVATHNDDGSKMGYTPVFSGPSSGLPATYTGAIVT